MSEKWADLFDAILAGTEAGKIRWELGYGGHSISADFSKHVISIHEVEEMRQYLFQVMDRFDQVLDSFTDDDLTAFGYEGSYSKTTKLFNAVKRSELGADDAIDDIIGEISGDS